MVHREAGQSLIDFTDDVGVPETLLTVGAGEFNGQNTDFVKHDGRMRMQLHNLVQVRHSNNHAAEREIGLLAKCWKSQMTKKVISKYLWDFGLVYEAELLSRISRGKGKQNGY